MAKRDFRKAQRLKPLGKDGIEACRKILAEKSFAKVNEVMVDIVTAAVIVRVHESISPEHQAKLEAMNVAKAADVCYRCVGNAIKKRDKQ